MTARAPSGARPADRGQGPRSGFARLLTGFYAHACEQEKLAEERLFQASDPGGPLEDWRLFLLSDAAVAQGHILLSQASLARLIGDHPASALRPRALVKAATSPGSARTRSGPWS